MPEVRFGPPASRVVYGYGVGANVDLVRGVGEGFCRCDDSKCDALIHMDVVPPARPAAQEGRE